MEKSSIEKFTDEFNSLSNKDKSLILQHFNIDPKTINLKNIIYSIWSENFKDIPDEHQHVFQDSISGKYCNTKSISDYVDECEKRKADGCTLLDYEIISKTKHRKLFLTVPYRYVGDEKMLHNIARELGDWLAELLDKESVRYKIFKDDYLKVYEIRYPEIMLESYEDEQKIIKKFIDQASQDSNIMLHNNIDEKFKQEHKKAISFMHDSNDDPDYAKWLSSKKISPSFRRTIIERVGRVCMTYKRLDTVIINNLILCENSGDVHINLKENPYEDKNNLFEFVRHILEDKPDWYMSAEYLPKFILTEKYNEIFETCESSRSLLSKLKKYKLYNKIALYDKICRISLEGDRSKSYNCIKTIDL